jgi:hypothetical protein
MKIRWLLLCVCVAGCADAKAKPVVEYINAVRVGKTLDASVIPTSYNESTRTQIRTERGNIVIEGARSIILGQESFVRTAMDGTKEFCMGIPEECFRMY